MSDLIESKPLFDIPIYRCSEEKYGKEFAKQEREYMQGFDSVGAPQSYAKIKDLFMQTYWYPWKFNEIVGYIHLHVERSPKIRVKIDGDIFYVKAKRIAKGGKGRIFGRGKIFEHFVYPNPTSTQIYENLSEGLVKLRQRRPLVRRYLYLEDFHRIGLVVNWRQLIGLE